MGKKNLKPQQQQPVIRHATAKALSGLSEENLTTGWGELSQGGALPASIGGHEYHVVGGGIHGLSCSFDGDDAE